MELRLIDRFSLFLYFVYFKSVFPFRTVSFCI
ncbi:putative basic proline-rich protein-like isoform X2 [Iris pallida]|uniref:Basic proline-rich protein-like isoform X2 n=1 Tax=Iris pallida TaxID=29817 RepID=A0AAX6IG71_IRIPA|nr:putative basic proline-rich protein-like isoform X2 [Iris pallida]